jgi:hypothetical protein
MKGEIRGILRSAIDDAVAPLLRTQEELEQRLDRAIAEREQLQRELARVASAQTAGATAAAVAHAAPPPLPREAIAPAGHGGPPALPTTAAGSATVTAAVASTAGAARAPIAAATPAAIVQSTVGARPPLPAAAPTPITPSAADAATARLEALARAGTSIDDLPLALNGGRKRAVLGWLVFVVVAAGLATAAGAAYWSQLHH